jgi:anti-anti-sigma factor
MKITQHTVGDVTVIVPVGRIVTEDGDVLRNVVDTLVQQGRVKIVLDLQQVTYVDSSGLGLMVSKYVSARRRGGDVKLLHPSARSIHLLEITHLAQSSRCSSRRTMRFAPSGRRLFRRTPSEDDASRATVSGSGRPDHGTGGAPAARFRLSFHGSSQARPSSILHSSVN